MDEERTMVQNAYDEDEGACETANQSFLNAARCINVVGNFSDVKIFSLGNFRV